MNDKNRQQYEYSWHFKTVKNAFFMTFNNRQESDCLWHFVPVKSILFHDIWEPSRVCFLMTFWNRQEFRCLWHLRTVKKFIVHDISEPSNNFPFFYCNLFILLFLYYASIGPRIQLHMNDKYTSNGNSTSSIHIISKTLHHIHISFTKPIYI